MLILSHYPHSIDSSIIIVHMLKMKMTVLQVSCLLVRIGNVRVVAAEGQRLHELTESAQQTTGTNTTSVICTIGCVRRHITVAVVHVVAVVCAIVHHRVVVSTAVIGVIVHHTVIVVIIVVGGVGSAGESE
jgi:hypothetical protein